MSAADTIVIVGGGQAGARAAQAIRAAGFEGSVILAGEETHLPYERPPLSKKLLRGSAAPESVGIHPGEWYGANRIELRLGAAVSRIDPDRRTVRIDGATQSYDRLILATGARPRLLPVPGASLRGVSVLRTLDDSLTLRAGLRPGTRLVVVGGGLIGLETAASASTLGCAVTVIEATERLMGRVLPPEVSTWFLDLHRAHGVEVRLRTGVKAFAGDSALRSVRLTDGTEIPADLVIIGVGVQPNIEIAGLAGLAVENGIVVDELCCTSDAHIYAAGDCSNQPSPLLGRRVRLESYQNAQEQGPAAGANAVGVVRPYRSRLWLWSDQYETNLQALGSPEGAEETVLRGDVASGRFMAFQLRANRLAGVSAVNAGASIAVAERLMAAGRPLDAAALADESVPLRKLLQP